MQELQPVALREPPVPVELVHAAEEEQVHHLLEPEAVPRRRRASGARVPGRAPSLRPAMGGRADAGRAGRGESRGCEAPGARGGGLAGPGPAAGAEGARRADDGAPGAGG